MASSASYSSYTHVNRRFPPIGTSAEAQELQGAPRRTSCDVLPAAPLAVVMFVLAIAAHCLTGVLVLRFQPHSKGSAGGVDIPSNATCMRVTRHSDYATADVIVGSPPTQMHVLLRLDKVLEPNNTRRALRLFSQDAVESKTATCSVDDWCRDVVVLTDGDRYDSNAYTAEFDYRHGLVERSMGTTASRISGVVGELSLRKGYSYWLTSTHFCYGSAGTTNTSTEGRVGLELTDSGRMVVRQEDMRSNDVLASVPAASDQALKCMQHRPGHPGDVIVFPEGALLESTWLSISDTGMYNSEPEVVETRRLIAEVGTTCASNLSEFDRDIVFYNLDCTPLGACRNEMSVPFRRAATSSLFFNLERDGNSWMSVKKDPTLNNLPKLANSTDAFLASLFRMAMITVAAAVVFVRSKRKTASSSWLFKNCVSIYCGNGPLTSKEEGQGRGSQAEDKWIGFVAFVSRILVVCLRFELLTQDHQTRVCIAELVGGLLSCLHWINRWYCLCEDDDEPAVSKLGGSTAIVDSTAAVMLAFSESPTLASSSSQFDPTARMLVALLVSIIVLTRCAFSAACCGTLWPVFRSNSGRMDYALVHMTTAAGWCVQSAILAILVCDLFVTPAAHSMSRAVVGDRTMLYILRVTLFLGIVCAGLPRLMSTTRHILSTHEHVD